MGVRVVGRERRGDGAAALYDSVTGTAFGPVFNSADDADEFLRFLDEIGERDPRVIPAVELAQLHAEWQTDREAA